MTNEIPKLRRADESAKITIYLDPDVVELYKQAKKNGWDAPRIARLAVEREFREMRGRLAKKAE